jgi:gamma-glutamyltranspeptidase/glutathione hydrolase
MNAPVAGARVRDMLRSAVVALGAAAVLALGAVADGRAQPVPEGPSGWTDKIAVTGRRFMIAAANPHAVDAGYAMLARGGSAVDAAIAAQLVLNLVEPQSSGIGGGAFMLVHDAKRNRLVAYDGRETAPAAAAPDRFLDRDGKPVAFRDAVVGGRSVGVPGVVALLEATHRAHGRLPWAELFAPAIVLAENGFAVSPRLHTLLAADKLLEGPRARAYFYAGPGRPYPVGHVLKNPAFARTLRAIATGGAKAFYEGEIARDVVDTANLHPTPRGDLTLADLAAYRVVVREPVCGPYRGYRVCGMPPPSSGGITLLQMLAMLEPFDVAAMGPASFWSVHFISEAGRLAYADRGAYVADPAFVAVPAGLLDPAYLAARGALISPRSSLGRASAGNPPSSVPASRRQATATDATLELPSTSHLSVVDRHGNAVAMTASIEDAFGSRRMTAGGFLLNNQMTDFSFVPAIDGRPVANRVEPGKRPRSSMAPTIVYDRGGRVFMVAGSVLGADIINIVAKTTLGVIDWKLDPRDAVALPNFGSVNGPTRLERGTPVAGLAPKLEALGHDVQVVDLTSGTQLIVRTPGGWTGAADPRREGTVRGQ